MRKPVLLSWSSGKDSAWALYQLMQDPSVEVVGLLTTLNEAFDRVAMHAVRRSLLELQGDAAGLPMRMVSLPWPCTNGQYERIMTGVCARARSEGIQAVAFGDLFLRDVRRYREQQLDGTGLDPLFPLWEEPTASLAHEMLAGGLRAKLTCVDSRQLGREFVGRDFSLELLSELPDTADPCGENGEFHSFVHAGPMFKRDLRVTVGDVVEREGFFFADLVLDTQT